MTDAPGSTGFKLDPRTKIICMIMLNITVFTAGHWLVMALAALISLSLLLLYGKLKPAIILAVLYAVALLCDTFLVDQVPPVINVIIVMLSGVICRMLPCFIWGYILLSKTTVSEFVAAMERIHMPKQIIIPFSVMFRFFPTIKEESASIGDAMKMRSISFGKTKGGPIALMEYRLVPLFISCVKIGDELSSSALTRGLGSPVKRTNICNV